MLTSILGTSTPYFEALSHPLVLAVALIAAAWIWEDGAVVSGALLASDQSMPLVLAVIAVLVGILSGDGALYLLGRWSSRWRGLRKWALCHPRSRIVGKKFRTDTWSNIFLIRFIPGLRTLGFTLCGLWKVSPWRFVMAMTVAGVVWIGLIFTSVYQLGSSDLFLQSHWKWSLIGVAVLLLLLNNFGSRLWRPVGISSGRG